MAMHSNLSEVDLPLNPTAAEQHHEGRYRGAGQEQSQLPCNTQEREQQPTSALVGEDSQVLLLVTAKHSIAQVPLQQIRLLWHRKDLGKEVTEPSTQRLGRG